MQIHFTSILFFYYSSCVKILYNKDNANTSEESRSREIQYALSSFLEQSLYPAQEGLKYIVCSQTLWERIFGHAPLTARRQQAINTGAVTDSSPVVLSPDETGSINSCCYLWTSDYQFLSMTFLGQDHELTIHDFLTYTVTSYILHNPCVSALVTYILHIIRSFVRAHFGTKNLAKKTFLNQRFLLRG